MVNNLDTTRVSVVIPTYRDPLRAAALVRELRAQDLPVGVLLEIIVVDDGSGDNVARALALAVGDDAKVIDLPVNVGRSAARNAGTSEASSELIMFMDCDCLPETPRFIRAHLAAWDEGTVATIGHVVGNGEGFWHRYQSTSSLRRQRQHAAGVSYSGSSQNFMVRRTAFDACGGFDTAYRGYGFEDRDLQIRLMAHGEVRWAGDATVRHMDELCMSDVARKLAEAGGNSARIFRERHPEAYRQLGYSSLDVDWHPWLRLPATLAARMVPALARGLDRMLAKRWLPYPIASLLVRALSAASYLSGARPG
ncbi:MAG TPA: glycosyltransferase [Arenimonas sp.]|uniref:glycosyltransferase n=1 Tax=Arenimonas sp. TaxID=1872635 RepID=UPI002D7E33BB|nr:glycosyltransferase [Arenimonas sp.]HEU0153890.1 glycosyltransferase [Arenimonas sp.]